MEALKEIYADPKEPQRLVDGIVAAIAQAKQAAIIVRFLGASQFVGPQTSTKIAEHL